MVFSICDLSGAPQRGTGAQNAIAASLQRSGTPFTHVLLLLISTTAARLPPSSRIPPAAAHDGTSQFEMIPDTNGAPYYGFGTSVAISANGSIAAVGALPGYQQAALAAAFVFVRNSSGAWTQRAMFTQPGNASAGAENGFGLGVALSGTGEHLLLGACVTTVNGNYEQGVVYAYSYTDADGWLLSQQLVASDGEAKDAFGATMAMDASGTYALITSQGVHVLQGAGYMFVRNGSAWTQWQKLVADDGQPFDNLGFSVGLSADGTYAIMGAMGVNDYDGAVYIFKRNASNLWAQQQKLPSPSVGVEANFGWSVAITNDFVIAGLNVQTVGNNSWQGVVCAYNNTPTGWQLQETIIAADGSQGDSFGSQVALSAGGAGDAIAVISAPLKSIGDRTNLGVLYVYTKSNSSVTWTLQQELTASDGYAEDVLGEDALTLSVDGSVIFTSSNVKWHTDQQRGSAYAFQLS